MQNLFFDNGFKHNTKYKVMNCNPKDIIIPVHFVSLLCSPPPSGTCSYMLAT